MFRHCRHQIWNHEDRSSQRTRVALAIVFTALALAAPRAHGQRRSFAMQRGMMMRPFPSNTMFSVTMRPGFSNPNLVNGQTRPFPVNPTMFSATVPSRSSNPVMAGQPTPFTPSMAFGSNPFTRFGNFNQFASPFGFNANPYASLYGNAYGMAGYGGGGYGGGGNGGGGYGGGGNGGGYGGGNGAGSSYGSPYMSSYGGTDPSYAPDQQAVNDQQAELSQGTNRRKVYDEYLYKREKTLTTEEDRQKSQREQLQRSLNNPPATEIRSGQALNVILTDLGQFAATGDLASGESFPLPLDEEGRKHINVTRVVDNSGLLQNEGRLTCPLALSGREYKEVRERLAEQALDAARQVAQSGQVEAATLVQMQGEVDQLFQQLRKQGRELPISEYIAAKTFLNQFEAAIKAMRQPDSGSHFSGKYALKAKTVPELVKQMTEQGLQFAPAMPEDEAAYAALHSGLAAYYRAARAQSLAR